MSNTNPPSKLVMTPAETAQFIASCRILIEHSRTFYEVRDALSKALAVIDGMQPAETPALRRATARPAELLTEEQLVGLIHHGTLSPYWSFNYLYEGMRELRRLREVGSNYVSSPSMVESSPVETVSSLGQGADATTAAAEPVRRSEARPETSAQSRYDAIFEVIYGKRPECMTLEVRHGTQWQEAHRKTLQVMRLMQPTET